MTDTIRYLPDVGIPAPIIELDGAPMADDLSQDLVHLVVELSGSAPSAAVLRINDFGLEHLDRRELRPGTALKIKVPAHGERAIGDQPVFDGEIVAVTLDADAGEVPELVVEALDGRYRLLQGRSSRTFLNRTDLDVITELVRAAGLQLDGGRAPDALRVQRDHLVTSGAPFDVIDGLVDRAGGEWFCEDRKVLVVTRRDAPSGPTATYGRTLRQVSVRRTTLPRFDKVVLRSWDRMNKQEVTGEATASTALTQTQLDSRLFEGPSGSAPELVTHRYPVRSADEATKVAQGVARRLVSGAQRVRGQLVSAEATLRPGGTITLDGLGPKLSGDYVVGRVEHVWGDGGFTSWFETAGLEPDLGLADGTGEPAPLGGASWPELTIGVVTNLNDPDAAGRVKVKLPVLGADVETDWARVATPFGGAERGFSFLPEVNDEVLVGFEGGDPARPVVLGALWGLTDKPPAVGAAANGKVDERGITSRLGSTLSFGDGDAEGDQHVLLTEHAGGRIRLGADRCDVEMPNGKPIVVKAGRTNVTIDQNGHVVIEGNDITIKGSGNVSIEGNQVSLKAQSSLKVEGVQAQVKATGQLSLESSGTAALKGTMVQIN